MGPGDLQGSTKQAEIPGVQELTDSLVVTRGMYERQGGAKVGAQV